MIPDLNFHISGVEVPPHAAAPQLHFKLHITNASTGPIHTAILHCQVQIAAVKRTYSADEQERLRDLFGEPERWGQTLRNTLWTHTQATIPAFVGDVVVNLPVTCTYDMNIVGTKYFYGLESGEVPLLFLFSGTIFYAAADDRLQVSQIAWNKEASFRLPVNVWQEMIAQYYPNTTFVILARDTFDRLYAFKRNQSLPTWEHTIERLLAKVENDESISP